MDGKRVLAFFGIFESDATLNVTVILGYIVVVRLLAWLILVILLGHVYRSRTFKVIAFIAFIWA